MRRCLVQETPPPIDYIAEYGLLRWVIQGIQDSELLKLQLIVTGTHLSPEFGSTVQEIEADGFHIDHKLEMLLSSDSAVGITKSMGLGMIGFADVLADLQPDLLLVLGDRFDEIGEIVRGHIVHAGNLLQSVDDLGIIVGLVGFLKHEKAI